MSRERVVDVDRIAEIITSIGVFDWTWTRADVDSLIVEFGWIETCRSRSVSVLTRPDPYPIEMEVAFADNQIDAASLLLFTTTDKTQFGQLQVTFGDLDTRLREHWGDPARVPGSSRSSQWAFPAFTLHLLRFTDRILLRIKNTARRQSPLDAEQYLAGLVDCSQLLEQIPRLVRTDLTDWTRTTVARAIADTGWPPTPSLLIGESICAGLKDDRVSTTAIARRTNTGMAKYGYGEFDQLTIRQILAPSVLDTAYRTASSCVVDLLGPPRLVGGPNATTMWLRSDDTTVTLDCSTTAVSITVAPTSAREELEHLEQKWDMGGDWSPEDIWQVEVDLSKAGQNSAPPLPETYDGMTVTSWTELDDCIDELLVSLATDLPLLHTYLGLITWKITADDSDRWFVRGWASRTGCYLEQQDRSGQRADHHYPPGREGGKLLASATKAALRTSGVSTPEHLYCTAWSKPKLRSFRIGLQTRT